MLPASHGHGARGREGARDQEQEIKTFEKLKKLSNTLFSSSPSYLVFPFHSYFGTFFHFPRGDNCLAYIYLCQIALVASENGQKVSKNATF